MTQPSATEIKDMIRTQAQALGFDAVGFASVQLHDRDKAALARFVTDGAYGDMAWMSDTLARRSDPQILWPDAASVLSLGVNYGTGRDPLTLLETPEKGMISIYAQRKDYHDVIKKRLKALARWIVASFDQTDLKVFVDTAPILEKALAGRAHLGWQGKHTNLVSRDFGSWLFLGEIFLTLPLPGDGDHKDQCGSCTACQTACPTNAFPAPYQLDARRCISYLTIEHKGHIPEDFRKPMANRIYGCDDCLAVCPWNKFAQLARDTALAVRPDLTAPNLIDLAGLDDAAFREMFRGTPVKRLGRDRFVRNVLIALGNSGQETAAEPVAAHLTDESPLVRAMAVWALKQLLPNNEFAAYRTRYLPMENDADVIREWR